MHAAAGYKIRLPSFARMKDARNPWTTLSETTVYDNPWIHVAEHRVLNPIGNESIYGVVRPKNLAIGIVPVDEQGYTWLVGQWRYPQAAYSWEIPEGGCPKGTDPLDTAKRELAEETGLTAARYTHLADVHLSNSISDELGHLYLAEDLTQGTATPEDTEELQVVRVPLEEAFRMVQEGRITDALSIIGLQHVWLRQLRGRP